MSLNDYSNEQLEQAFCQHYRFTPAQLAIFVRLLPTLQPWETDWLKGLVDERAADKQQLAYLSLAQAYDWGLGSKGYRAPGVPSFVLPPGYTLTRQGETAVYAVTWKLTEGALKVELGSFASQQEAQAAIMAHDRQHDPYRWRPLAETCPDQTMLLFACADWAHAVELGRPVPVKTGFRNGADYTVFGSSWTPTHWCYQPPAPVVAPAKDSQE